MIIVLEKIIRLIVCTSKLIAHRQNKFASSKLMDNKIIFGENGNNHRLYNIWTLIL